MQFDAKAAKLLQPGQHFTISDCPGLRLEATASTRSWTYRYKSPVDSRMRQVKIGTWPAMSYHSAVVAWEKLRDIRSSGEDPSDQRRAARQAEQAEREAQREAASKKVTIRRICDQYLDEHVDPRRQEKGAKEVRRLFNVHLGELADLDPSKLTRAQAFDLLQGMIDTPVLASNLRRELGAAWDHALDAGRLDENVPNWWRLLMRGKLRSRGRILQGERIGTAKRVLSDGELGQLIRWLPNFSRTVDDALTLYLWTLLRGAEITSMHAKDITEEKDGLWWTIPKAETKNRQRERAEDHRVPLVGRAEAIVRRRLGVADQGYLFPSRGRSGHVEQKALGVAVWTHMPYSETRPDQQRPRLPVTRWGPHDLRRSCRTLLAAMGCPDPVGEVLIGHLPPDTGSNVYNRHRYDRERREWLVKLADRLEQLGK
ncbi:tyrosine-type recombinase/integrase [Massilia sp. DD77]|uniref:tyrosine-type recombinase/integrase n=1 Tax=Massilia sp. DD77 TaxID=3109349 RepID=UPI002FFF51F6